MKFKIETTGKIQTPMQELIERYKTILDVVPESIVSVKALVEDLESMLGQEKETVCNAFSDAQHGAVESMMTAEEYFEETFKTKEK